MKETLYTIPLTDAFNEQDECPFCFIRRKLEQDALDFILGSGSAYMESDVRKQTNQSGFCADHYKLMFKYGNSLGNAIMIQSYLRETKKELEKQMNHYSTEKVSLVDKLTKNTSVCRSSLYRFTQQTTKDCFVCNKINDTFDRYIDTFFFLYQSKEDFRTLFKQSKGFCLSHFGLLTEAAEEKLGKKQKEEFYAVLFPQMEENLQRLDEDISWFIEKFDYQNKDADWKDSRDALQRTMQKMTTGYPADDFYRSK